MKRRAFQIVVLLILGAIVNVAVAWGSAYSIDLEQFHMDRRYVTGNFTEDGVDREGDREWFTAIYRAPSGIFIFSVRYTSDHPAFGYNPVNQLAAKSTPNIGRLHTDKSLGKRALEARGWPMLSVWCEYDPQEVERHSKQPFQKIQGGIRVDGAIVPRDYYYITVPLVLPYWPLVPGFAINTIFYAAMLWVVFFVPGMVRRKIRRRRGLCPACAYPIGTSPVCTECGAAIPGGRSEGAKDCSHG